MKYILTGAAGFIGSNIAERLIKDGHGVVGLDSFHTGSRENLVEGMEIVKGTTAELEKLDKRLEIDGVFHEGIYSSSPMYKENPNLTAKVIDEWITLLEWARKKDVKKIVFASSSSIYNGHAPPHREDMKIFVTDLYTEGRYAMERLGELYSKLYGMRTTALRYFSIYGPKEKSKGKYANLISQFLWAMKKDEKPVIYGDGTQTRDFTYVSDVVEANVLAMKRGINGVYNVGTGRATSLNELVELLNRFLNKRIAPHYIESPIKNYVQYTQADTSKAKKELGFKAKVSLEEGIEKLMDYYG